MYRAGRDVVAGDGAVHDCAPYGYSTSIEIAAYSPQQRHLSGGIIALCVVHFH